MKAIAVLPGRPNPALPLAQDDCRVYLLAYQSTNTTLDGTFRRVSVKVNRPNLTVRARQGYVATPVADRR